MRLETEREARGWGRWAMARRLLTAVGIDHHDPTRVKNLGRQILGYEKGEHFPRDWSTAYATALDLDEEDLFPEEEAYTLPVGTVNESPVPEHGSDEVKRRAALQLIGAIGAGTAVPPGVLEQVLAGIEDALDGPLDLPEWERVVHEHGQRIVTRPAGALVGDLTADIIAVGELLKRKHTTPERAGLLRVSSNLSGLLAIDVGDMGDQRAARVTWNTAKRAADASGDHDLRVWVRGRAAEEAAWARRPARVVTDLVNEAVALAGDPPSRGLRSGGLARAHSAHAYMAADRGDASQARASIADLHRTFERMPQSDELSALSFRESQLRWVESFVHTRTGHKQADATLSRAMSLYPAEAQGPLANLALMQAAHLVRTREIDAGLKRALTALEDTHIATTARLSLANMVLQALPEQARSHPAARELRELTTAA
ncbi:XRE family transcriptional regulator [Actinomadura rugatobispora]|uniref:XRE family transcriptional regulator n=1 Tax=Actinomadura rugatobispora TaxID=1994 RepID=A0ABW0ZVN4_9ACTN